MARAIVGKRPETSLQTRLIVNADDLGICPRVNDGIFLAHRRGIVTAASLMAVGRAFGHAVARCHQTPTLDIGVHLTLVAGTPLCGDDVPSLIDTAGRFPEGIGAFLARFVTGHVRLSEIRREWTAQIERILDHGLRVTHLDSHQHLHVLPGLCDIAIELADRYDIAFIRQPFEPIHMDRPVTPHAVSRMIGVFTLRAFHGWADFFQKTQHHRKPLCFIGFQDGGRLDSKRLTRILARLVPAGIYELMCHPGKKPDSRQIRRWGYHHEAELSALMDPAIRSRIAESDIALCGFSDVTALLSAG